MRLPVYKAMSFNGIILKGGHSKPWVVSVNAEGGPKPFVVKLYRTIDIEARNKMAAEILGCLLAEEFDLLTPSPAVIEFTDEFRMTLSKEYEEILNLLDERNKFGVEYYEGTFLFAPQMSLEEAEKIISVDTLYAFDYFICNRDRTLRKPNLLIKGGNGVLIDHEMALEIDENTISNFKEGKWNEKYRYHLFYDLLKGADLLEKESFFKEFEFYLQSLRLNKYDGIFEQLNDLGFTNLNQELIMKYFNTVLSNPQNFKEILRKSMKRIVYSILQYRHSMLRNEVYGIGIVFYFPDEGDKMVFYTSQYNDLRYIYQDADCQMLATYLAFIDANVRRGKIKHYFGMTVDMELKLFLKECVLLEDSTVLHFTDPVIVSNVDSADPVTVLNNYVKMLLSFQDGGEHNMIRNLILQ